MSLSDQEKREWAHFQAFCESVTDFPEGRVPLEPKERSPDFRVIGPNCVVGIEHTEVYHKGGGEGIPPQARETYVTRITRRARQIYESEGNPPVSVWPSFSTNARVGKHSVDRLARKLAEVVEANLPEKNDSVQVEQTWRPSDPLPCQFHAVHIMRYVGVDRNFWFPPMTGAIPEVPIEYIRERVQSKENKLSEYRNRSDQTWLLMVVAGNRPSTFFDVAGSALEAVYETGFDRVYLFDFQNQAAHRLATEARES